MLTAALEVNRAVSLAATTKMALTVEYEGTHYYGFQLQANLPTIQGELEKAIWRLTGEKVRVMAASRTDTGVHAEGQMVSFRTSSTLPERTFINGLNYYLPRDIAIKAVYKISDSFDVRRDAYSREYSYYILNSSTRSPLRGGFCYWVSESLDIGAMNQACQTLIGEHDFISFATSLEAGKTTTRRMYRAEIDKNGDLIILRLVANSFLPHQVRNTIGALVRVGLGKMTVSEFGNIIEARSPGLAGPTAPACGLFLMHINYSHLC